MNAALVTGSCGFLGRWIARELITRGWDVAGLDRVDMSRAELDELRLTEHLAMDLPAAGLADALQRLAPTLIVHAAGPGSVQRSFEDPVADFNGSVLSLQCVLEALRGAGSTCSVMYLSSAAVYGEPAEQPVTEDAPRQPLSPYGYHKLMGEQMVEEYARDFGIRACSLRIFSAYGPGLRGQVLWDICHKLQDRSVVELMGTGEETRDFVHAGDVARGVAVAAQRAAFEGEAYNIAAGRSTTIRDLAGMLARALASSAEISFSAKRRQGDPVHWRADIGRLAKLGYQPQVSLESGVAEYAEWLLHAAATT